MPQTIRAASGTIKLPEVKIGPSKGRALYQILPFEMFLREIWPQDRTKNYTRVTGASIRTAKRRISGQQPPPAYEEIVALLRSEHGFQFLKHMMGEARPEWFASVVRAKSIGDLRRQVALQGRRLAQLEMEIE